MKSLPAIRTSFPSTPGAYFRFVLRPYRWLALSAAVVVITASALGQGSSYFFKLIIDAVEAGDTAAAMQWGIAFPITIFVVQLLYRLSGYLGARLSNYASKSGYDALVEYLLGHSHTFYTNRFAGSITNKVRNVVGALEETIPDFLWAHLNAVTAFLVTLGLIATVDVVSSVIFVALLITLGVVNQFFAKQKAVLAKANAEAGSALQGRLADVFGNASVVRQYVRADHEATELQALTTVKRTAGLRNWFYTERLLLINSAVLFLFSIVMFVLLIERWSSNAISTGDFVLVLALVSQITGSLLFVGRAFNATARTIGELREGLDELVIGHEIVDHPDAATLRPDTGLIEMYDVNFTYNTARVLEGFSLTIPAGQRVGLVGASGAGKSTLVSLLLRQYDIESGEILIDRQNIARVTQDSLRASIAVVPQEPALFHRTIRENIAYGKTGATDEEIIAVAKKAYAHDFIMELPQGYDTLVGERGVKLSGGQKQRIAIARAMIKDAPILLLDEATSALDSESEVAIQRALHQLMRGKTVIAIAHRLSTLREMDRIIVLEQGQIVEDGTHDTLREYGGTYARLWDHQAGGFLVETVL